MTEPPRKDDPAPLEVTGAAIPPVGGERHAGEPAGKTVHVFEGTVLPEPGSAEAISSIEDRPSDPGPFRDEPPPIEPAAMPPIGSEGDASAAGPSPRTSGIGGLLACGLLAGIAGACLALAAQLWLSPSSGVEERMTRLEQRASAPAPQAAEADRRLAALETEAKTLGERLRATRDLAEAGSKRAEEAATKPAPAPDPAQAAALAATGTRLAAAERTLAERNEAAAAAQAALERRLAEQDQRLAALARQLTETGTMRLEAGLRVIAADRLGTALRDGQPLGPYLPILERLKTEPGVLAALQPFAAAPAPDTAALARDFKPLAERIRSEQQAKPADWSGKLLGLADQIVTIRQTAPSAGSDPEGSLGRIEAALGCGALAEAAAAWDALPEPARRASQGWADGLKRRVAAEAAARQVQAQALASFDAATR